MVFTVVALLLFLEGRFAASAAACTAAVLIKETTISTPLVFALWLWFREGRRREALYFLAPAVALGIWLLLLLRGTGHLLGDPGFTQYNLTETLSPVHVILAIARRAYFLFIADGRWIGAIALFVGWRVLRGKAWSIAAWVALAQVAVVTLVGGAVLDRYLLPGLADSLCSDGGSSFHLSAELAMDHARGDDGRFSWAGSGIRRTCSRMRTILRW